jgi:hypothetical protein
MKQQRPGPRPESFQQTVKVMELNSDEERRLEAKKTEAADRGFESVEDLEAQEESDADSPLAAAADDPGEPDGPEVPPWVQIPEGMTLPVGRTLAFLRFPSAWTTRPEKGLTWEGKEKNPKYQGKLHRQCILWTLSVADEKLARNAAKGDSFALVQEMAKRQIRAIDGMVVDWSTGAVDRSAGRSLGIGQEGVAPKGHVPSFWDEVGPAIRSILVSHYQKSHTFEREQFEHFFLNCYVVRRGEAG